MYSLTCRPCLSWPFDPVGNGKIMRLTTFFGQIFFLTGEILLTSSPNYTVLTPVPKASSLGAIFVNESFILPTLNKLLQKSRLKPVAGICICNELQLDTLNVASIAVQGMPLSWLRLSGSAAASEEESRDARHPCECCIAVTVSLRQEQRLRQPKGSSGARGERGFRTT